MFVQRIIRCALLLALTAAGPGSASVHAAPIAPDTPRAGSHPPDIPALTAATARDVAALLLQPGFADDVRRSLQAAPRQGASLEAVMGAFDPQGHTGASSGLQRQQALLRWYKGLPAQGDGLLRLRAHVPAGISLAQVNPRALWVASAPPGDDRHWTTLTAYDAQGRAHLLDARVAPAFPVLIVDVDTRRSVQEGLAMVNAGLRAGGQQSPLSVRLDAAGQRASLDITRLDHIRLADDQEPWILGDADVFAIVSGLKVDAAAPEITTVEMPWLDHAEVDYSPHQALVLWGSYRFNAANVQLFEDDGDTNYQALLLALTDGVKAALGAFAPEFSVIADIAGAILKAMPTSWFGNDTDYLDSFYLLQRGQAYIDRMGAAGNAKVTLTPITLVE